MATIVFTIGGKDFSNYVDIFSISATDSIEAQGDQMDFALILTTTEIAEEPGLPKSGQIVSLSLDGIKQFEGVILNINQDLHVSQDTHRLSCQASGYVYLLASKVITQEFPAGLAGSHVRQIVATYAPGFGTRYIKDGYPVPKDEFDHVDMTGVINKFAQAIGFNWYVDFDREVHFSEAESLPSPIETLDVDVDTRIQDIDIKESVNQIANRVFVKDATARAAEKRTDTFVADGQQSFFRLFSPPFSADGAEVFKNDNPVTVYEDPLTNQSEELVGGPANSSFLCVLNAGLRFSLDQIPEEGDVIDVSYYPEEGGGESGLVIALEDPDSIRMMRQRESTTGYLSDGIHEAVISVPEMRVETLDPLSFLGGIVLEGSAWPEITGSFKTIDADVRDWRPGQSFYLKSVSRGLVDPRAFWRTGTGDLVRVHVESVGKRFRPYKKLDGSVDIMWEVTVNFTSIAAKVLI